MREIQLHGTPREQGIPRVSKLPRNARSAAREIVVAADIFPECRLENDFFVVTTVLIFPAFSFQTIERSCPPSSLSSSAR